MADVGRRFFFDGANMMTLEGCDTEICSAIEGFDADTAPAVMFDVTECTTRDAGPAKVLKDCEAELIEDNAISKLEAEKGAIYFFYTNSADPYNVGLVVIDDVDTSKATLAVAVAEEPELEEDPSSSSDAE